MSFGSLAKRGTHILLALSRQGRLVSALLAAATGAHAQGAAELEEPPPFAFRIAPTAAASPDDRAFIATFGTGADFATFLIELHGRRVMGRDAAGNPPPVPVFFSSGVFRHVEGSRPATFFRRLAISLDAKSPTLSTDHGQSLPFELAILGEHVARAANGGFTGGEGQWTTTKIFLANGDAEVFFNFNPGTGEAEFTIKDEDYGNTVVQQLSRVVW